MQRQLDISLRSLKGHAYNVLNVVKSNAPFSQLLYVEVLIRSWWHPLTRELSDKLDYYIVRSLHKKFHVKENWPHELLIDNVFRRDPTVMPGMLRTADVHLNHYGYRAMTKAILRPILSMWLASRKKLGTHTSCKERAANRNSAIKCRTCPRGIGGKAKALSNDQATS